MKNRKIILNYVDIGILLVVGVGCGFVFFQDVNNAVHGSPEKLNYPMLIFYVLLLMIPHFIIHSFIELNLTKENAEVGDKIVNATTSIVDSLKGVEKITFKTIDEVNIYVAERISTANVSVKDLNWQDFKPSPFDSSHEDSNLPEEQIDKSIPIFCKKHADNKDAVYQEIFTFPKTNSINLKKLKEHLNSGDIYTCSYFDYVNPQDEAQGKFPKLQFVIIDDIEVIFVSSEYDSSHCAVKDKSIVYICRNYFNQAWQLSKLIKAKNQEPNHNKIKYIEERYSKNEKGLLPT